ncbi:MAG: hypothetical protein K9J17_08575 [Flavobacteriales bacterium]|nr:hypothetical protein [Flavobacteriales bacterium]
MILEALAVGIAFYTVLRLDKPHDDGKSGEEIVTHELIEIASPKGNASLINGDSTKGDPVVFQSDASGRDEKKQPIKKPEGLLTIRAPISYNKGFPVETFTVTNYFDFPIVFASVMIDIVRFDPLLKSGKTGEVMPTVEYKVELKPSKGKYELPLPAPVHIMPNESWSSKMLLYTLFAPLDSLKLRPQDFGTYGFTVTFKSSIEGITTESVMIDY